MSPLRKLTIEHLRGSVVPFSLLFDPGKRLTVIYGENATGKTTICDAFEFIGKGKVGSLENRGLGNSSRYWPSVRKKASDVVVSLQAGASTCSGRISKGEVSVQPPELRPKVEVLRRSQILSLVEAAPAARYGEIRRFIDVSDVETSEASLRELIKTLENDRETAVTRVQQNLETIQQFWETAGKHGGDSLNWAAKEAVRDPATLVAARQNLAKLRTAYEKLVACHVAFIEARDQLAISEVEAGRATRKLGEILATASEQANGLLELLDSAKSLLGGHPDPKQCPLCESAERVAGLSTRVDDRLKQFAAVRTARDKKSEGDRVLHLNSDRFTQRKIALEDEVKAMNAIVGATVWPEEVDPPQVPCPEDPAEIELWLQSTASLPGKWSTTEGAYHDKESFLGTLKKALLTYKENSRAQEELAALLPKLKRTLEIAEEERRWFTDKILAAIAGEVGSLYECVHPGEDLSKISLLLDPKKRASLDIQANIFGQTDGPPQAYFSDSLNVRSPAGLKDVLPWAIFCLQSTRSSVRHSAWKFSMGRINLEDPAT